MDKRGIAEGIDWAIALGLFLVYVTLVFVFFKPGVTSYYDQETLLNIVQDNSLKNLTWEITKIPLFIAPLDRSAQGQKTIELKGTYPQGAESSKIQKIMNDKQQDLSKIEIFYVEREQGDVRPNPDAIVEEGENSERERVQRIRGTENSEETKERENGLQMILTEQGNIAIPVFLAWEQELSKKTKYLLIHASETLNFQEAEAEQGNILTACEWTGEEDLTDEKIQELVSAVDSESICKVIYVVGVEDKITGVSLEKFNALSEEGYTELKREWNFPATKDFRIDIINKEGNIQEYYPREAIIPENINVYARLINGFILNDEGNREPVIISIKTW